MKKSLLLFSLLIFGLSSVIAQGKWELKKNEDGIEVFTRKPAKGNLKELRVVCELEATKTQLINELQNIGDYNSWVYANKKSEIIKMLNQQTIIYYSQSRLPWPIKDRDLIIQLTISPTPELLTIQAKSLPDYLPRQNDYIRVPYSLAIWKVTQGTNNKLKVDYTFSVDPGGSIPSWLVNATITVGPYNSFFKLREILRAQKQPVIN
jgi:hypothetical protein